MLCAIPLEKSPSRLPGNALEIAAEDKERSRQRALELFPAAHALFARKLDHGRAEAALLALFGLKNSRFTAAPPGAQTGSINETHSQDQTYDKRTHEAGG